MERAFSIGRIAVSSAGTAGVEIDVRGIVNPEQAKQIIDRTQYGQATDDLTPEQPKAIERQTTAEEKMRARAKGRERRAEVYTDLSARLGSGAAATSEELKRLPGRTDHMLQIIAGKENRILLWFSRIVTVVLAVGLAVGILTGIISLISSLVL